MKTLNYKKDVWKRWSNIRKNKNEHFLSFLIDMFIVLIASILLNFIFGYPRIFNYFAASNELLNAISHENYVEMFMLNEQKLNYMIYDTLTMYALYEIVFNILFSQTLGKKFFQLKTYNKKENKFMEVMTIISKTFTKVFSFMYIIPFVIIGIHYLLTKGNKTLLDKLYGTETC